MGELYRFGPGSELIGRPAPSGQDAEFTLADADLYEDVDPESLALPALVRGEVGGEVGPGEPIAVAVNGTVAAVGRTL